MIAPTNRPFLSLPALAIGVSIIWMAILIIPYIVSNVLYRVVEAVILK